MAAQVVAYARTIQEIYDDAFSYRGIITVSLHGSAYVPNTSHTVNDLSAELSGGNYVRKQLQGRENLFDTASNRYQFSAAPVSWFLLTGIARYAVVSDPSGPLFWVDFGSNRQVFNATFTVSFENDLLFEIAGAA